MVISSVWVVLCNESAKEKMGASSEICLVRRAVLMHVQRVCREMLNGKALSCRESNKVTGCVFFFSIFQPADKVIGPTWTGWVLKSRFNNSFFPTLSVYVYVFVLTLLLTALHGDGGLQHLSLWHCVYLFVCVRVTTYSEVLLLLNIRENRTSCHISNAPYSACSVQTSMLHNA